MWSSPAVIAPNNFVYKSLSNWAFNIAVGCSHACRFCYVPSAATIKQGPKLAEYGVKDPDAEWGDYVILRPWEEDRFLASLRAAENTPRSQLKPDGNRAVMYCSTTYPECDEADLRATLRAVAEVEPVTIFHEPINIRAENVARIQTHADELGVKLKTDVFETREGWQDYAVNALQTVERLAGELGLADRLHLWPDKSLGNVGVANRMPNPKEHLRWLCKWWGRISMWPHP